MLRNYCEDERRVYVNEDGQYLDGIPLQVWEYRIGDVVQKGLNVMTVRNGLIVEGRGYTKGRP